LPTHAFDPRITLRMLLNQSSGLADYLGFPRPAGWLNGLSQPTVMTAIARAPLHFTSGSSFQYSNSNYFILGVVIEAVTSAPNAEYISGGVAVRSRLLVISTLFGLATMSGCTTTSGDESLRTLTPETTRRLLVPSKTTREEVEKNLGKTRSLRFDSGYEISVYECKSDHKVKQDLPRWVDFVPYVGLATVLIPRQSDHSIIRSFDHSNTTKEVRILFNPAGIAQKTLITDADSPPDLGTEIKK
jgi:hypothetical protein